MSRKGDSITLSCTPQAKLGLEAIALRLGYKWGNKPNISALIEAIGNGEVIVGEEFEAAVKLRSEVKESQIRTAIAKIKSGLDELGESIL